jgi:hypothetical protein
MHKRRQLQYHVHIILQQRNRIGDASAGALPGRSSTSRNAACDHAPPSMRTCRDTNIEHRIFERCTDSTISTTSMQGSRFPRAFVRRSDRRATARPLSPLATTTIFAQKNRSTIKTFEIKRETSCYFEYWRGSIDTGRADAGDVALAHLHRLHLGAWFRRRPTRPTTI